MPLTKTISIIKFFSQNIFHDSQGVALRVKPSFFMYFRRNETIPYTPGNTLFLLQNLTGYTKYNVTIRLNTKFIGNESEPFTFRTKEGGNNICSKKLTLTA